MPVPLGSSRLPLRKALASTHSAYAVVRAAIQVAKPSARQFGLVDG